MNKGNRFVWDGADEDNDPQVFLNKLQSGQIKICTLCEYDGGWHAVGDGTALELGGEDIAALLKLSCPYVARILAILKHSSINLQIISSDEGSKLLHAIEKCVKANQDIQPVYLALRDYVIAKDKQCNREGLKRCYMPNGKILWLCTEHQKLPRVSVLSTDAIQQEESDEKTASPEHKLLEALRDIANSTAGEQEEAVLTEISVEDGTKKKESKRNLKSLQTISEEGETKDKENIITGGIINESGGKSKSTQDEQETNIEVKIEKPEEEPVNSKKKSAVAQALNAHSSKKETIKSNVAKSMTQSFSGNNKLPVKNSKTCIVM